MRFDVITLFPELFAPFLVNGVTRRAYESGLVEVKLWNPRDFADGNYRRVDDRPFGGGPGMVMLAEPLALCLEKKSARIAWRRFRSGRLRFPPCFFRRQARLCTKMSYAKGLAPVAVLGVVASLLVSCSIRTTADGGPSSQDVAHGLNARGPIT